MALAREAPSVEEGEEEVTSYMAKALGLQRLRRPSRERLVQAIALASGREVGEPQEQ